MKNLIVSLRLLLFMSVLLGLGYSFAITGISQLAFRAEANGSLVEKDGQLVGSLLLAQSFTKPQYFWPRPSATDFNPLPSGGSNLGQANSALKELVGKRAASIQAANPDQVGQAIPQDLLFASGSGLDPHISQAAAGYQIPRVARARSLDPFRVKVLVDSATEKRQFGFLGEPRVNVLQLNLALDLAAQGGR